MYFKKIAIVLGLAPLAACSGDGRSTADPMPAGSFVSEYVDAVCAQADTADG